MTPAGSAASRRVARRLFRSRALSETAEITRHAPGDHNARGHWVPGEATTETIRCVTAPLSGQDRRQLPEGLRLAEGRRFWFAPTVAPVRPGETDGDLLVWNDITYRAVMTDDWGGFHVVVAIRPEVREAAGA